MSTWLAGTIVKLRVAARAVRRGAGAAEHAVLDLVFPPACRLCSELIRTDHDFCPVCRTALTVSEAQMKQGCQRCGHPLGRQSLPRPARLTPESESELTPPAEFEPPPDLQREPAGCPQCHAGMFHFHRVIAMWHYHGLVCDAVVAAKYVSQAPLADALGRRLGGVLAEQLREDPPTQITYVPSYFTRQWVRGGVGVRTLAEAVAATLHLPSVCLLRTSRPIAKQAWLDDQARLHNVLDAFQMRRRLGVLRSPDLTNQHILLVDDVYTTGATCNEVAKILRQAGARKVTIGVVARTVRSG